MNEELFVSLSQGDEKTCSIAYEAFFQRYPYCYGYWKKYSDMFKKHGDLIKAAEVSHKFILSFLITFLCTQHP